MGCDERLAGGSQSSVCEKKEERGKRKEERGERREERGERREERGEKTPVDDSWLQRIYLSSFTFMALGQVDLFSRLLPSEHL
jgi:hypothetical protein